MLSPRLPTRKPRMRGSRDARASPRSWVRASLAWTAAAHLKAPRAIIFQRLLIWAGSPAAGMPSFAMTVRALGRRRSTIGVAEVGGASPAAIRSEVAADSAPQQRTGSLGAQGVTSSSSHL